MPYANNNGVKIYYEVEGEGPPLVLVHGMVLSGKAWYISGYVSELKKDYRLIILDARGHGSSDKPSETNSYDFKTMADDVIVIMNDLNIEKAHYFGYSMGAYIGFHGIGRNYASRFNSLILGGFSVYPDKAIMQSLQSGLPVCKSAIEKGMQVYIPLLEQTGGLEITEDLQKYLSSLNPRALFSILQNIADSFDESSADEILPKIDLPCLAYAGEDDIYPSALKKTASKMPNARFISFSGLNHGTAFSRSDLILPHVKEFLAKANKR
jgi:pimeloyl-ACP methyl ester carboxylesterase